MEKFPEGTVVFLEREETLVFFNDKDTAFNTSLEGFRKPWLMKSKSWIDACLNQDIKLMQSVLKKFEARET